LRRERPLPNSAQPTGFTATAVIHDRRLAAVWGEAINVDAGN
jgi:hypothetical protein